MCHCGEDVVLTSPLIPHVYGGDLTSLVGKGVVQKHMLTMLDIFESTKFSRLSKFFGPSNVGVVFQGAFDPALVVLSISETRHVQSICISHTCLDC